MYYGQQPNRKLEGYPVSINHAKREIRVTGEGSIFVQPDVAEVHLGVETENLELQKAQSENARIISQVIQSLKQQGIAEENIKTIDYNVYPQYDFIEGKQVFRGYRVNHMLNVKVADINNVGLVVDTAVSNGANRVSNISFSISNPVHTYQQALSIAVQHAILNASTIAGTLQVNLIKTPLQIIEESRRPEGPIPFEGPQMVKSATTTPIEPGQQVVKAIVTAVFTFNL